MQLRQWSTSLLPDYWLLRSHPDGRDVRPRAALAPMGKLRVAFLLGPIYATKNSATGELKGVAIDLGEELARRLGCRQPSPTHASAT